MRADSGSDCKVRVVYLHQYFVTPDMSGGTRSYEMARRLVRDGHEVHMITSDQKGGSRRTEDIEGIQVTWIPVRYSQSMGVFRRIIAFLIFAVLASFEGIKKRPTVVFATSTPLTIVFPALAIKLFRRVPMVFEVRDLWPEMPIAVGALTNPLLIRLAKLLERFAYFQSSRVIALSPGMKEGVVETGYPEGQVEIIPNSSDIDRFQIAPELGEEWLRAQTWYRGGPLVLYAGSLGDLNEVDYLVDVASEMERQRPEIDFLVIGNGKAREDIRIKAELHGVLGKNFHLLSPVPKKEIPIVYTASTVSLSLFRNLKPMERNSANKFFDGLASGTPIAINYGGWHADLLAERNCGVRMSRDPHLASKQLAELVKQEEKSAQLGKNALQLAKDKFDRELLYRKLRDVLDLSEKRVG